MGIICKNMTNDLHECWRRPSPNTNCWNWKSLHSFHSRERLWTPNRVRLQQTTWELERLYDFIVFAYQLLCMGLTFGALQAFQPSACKLKEMRAQPSDGHVLLKSPDLWEEELLLGEVTSKMDKSISFAKRKPSDLSNLELQHHLEWHWL